MDGNKIHTRIQLLREEGGHTQKQIADAIKVKRETVNQWESGTRDLKTDAIIKLSSFFGVSTDYLLGVSEVPTLNEDLKAVCTYTGLSVSAAQQLAVLTTNEGPEICIVNHLLESSAFIDVCQKIAYLTDLVLEANNNVEEKVYQATFVEYTEDGLRVPHGLSSCEFFASIILRNLTRQVDNISGLQELRELVERKKKEQQKAEQVAINKAIEMVKEGKENGINTKKGN